MPRDHTGDFEPQLVKKHQKELASIEEQILALYAKGVSVRDIQDHLSRLYGVDVSPTLTSNVTNRIMPVGRRGRCKRPIVDPANKTVQVYVYTTHIYVDTDIVPVSVLEGCTIDFRGGFPTVTKGGNVWLSIER